MSNAPSVHSQNMTPREIGSQMAALREQFGLTPQEVSERLHIRTRYIHAIEEGR
ncbi:MAG: helix-turn-helix domain-containing protein, partial [Rickettsiales bacterium]|nr:helix-turn-helix domain-containing protein [Rickettsiales bacterium]